MTHPDSANLIAVDGGGTSCRIALLWRGVRHDAQTGAANASTNLDGTVSMIAKGLARVATDAGLQVAQIAGLPAYLGLAGVLSQRVADQVANGLPLQNAHVADDRESALVGALGDSDGAIASIGTGSFLGRQNNGRALLIGGYGLKLGDEASGAWLGRGLLGRILQGADGLAPHSPLSDRIFADFTQNTAEIVDFSLRATPQDYGRFAPDIAAAARDGDAIATDLMHMGADYITRGLAALNWQPDMPLALLGGVANSYLPFLPADVAGSVIAAKGSALDGALRLAARLGSQA